MNSLLITLGHNSSAIFVDNNGYIIGYEEERLTGIKSDSQFPIDAINEIIKNVGIAKMRGCKIFISHWFDFSSNVLNKYMTEMDFNNLKQISEDITFVSPSFTHHDAHAYSGKAFFNYHLNKMLSEKSNSIAQQKLNENPTVHILVADGFGNNGEVLSVYKIDNYFKDNTPKLIHRTYGYKNSIGLMYQYATSYVGMKENEDEYKFLGYEAHIDEYLSKDQISKLDKFIEDLTNSMWNGFNSDTNNNIYNITGDVIDFNELKNTKEHFHKIFDKIYKDIWNENCISKYSKEDNVFIQRCIVAYALQQTVEKFFGRVIEKFNITNTIVCGGSFYNVKLNNYIFEHTNGLFCAMPLAGDQGAAIGMYDYYTHNQFDFNTLCIGKRNFYGAEKVFKNDFYKEGTDELAKEIARKIADGHIVNLVHGSLEFGPRALMHTSSLFIPTVENTAQNNSNNLRNEVMPCAPVLTKKNAEILFGEEGINRVVGSDGFMILTHTYNKDFSKMYGGVMHKIVLKDGYSGRPQIVAPGTFEEKILQYVEQICDIKCLVNTSFNKHGTPILFRLKQIRDDHNFQVEHSKLNGYKKLPLLYVVEN